ncbi:MAG TPA: ABC transporter ATP-binding protein [Gaiellaceae bacterium]|nr:ABC transporter ATP-binding protein [Gaiellaceae bacterium]
MAALAIRAEGLAKRYRIGGRPAAYGTLRDALASPLLRLWNRRGAVAPSDELWALDDVSFEVEEGEAIGFIGRNGAGKTTLLKLLSRITRPTRGRADVYGRVGSLLEVGTGFHGELTGRENIFLNGAILGLTKRDIRGRFDEIVAFAEVERFLDTPVKQYSSGMTVRLAFAVAAHLEPEILLVDEVLAVGDLAFQRKCLGKMSDVTQEGRTVLFVSHNMAVIQALCRRGIFLERGRVTADGAIDAVVADYLRLLESQVSLEVLGREDRGGQNAVMLSQVDISGSAGRPPTTGAPARFAFTVTGVCAGLACSVTIYDRLGQPVTTLASIPPGPGDRELEVDRPCIVCEIEELMLVPGRYRIDVTLRGAGVLQDHLEGAAFFDVEQGVVRGRPVTGDDAGVVVLSHRWLLPPTA